MPTYDYRCKKCSHSLEIFHSPFDEIDRTCPACEEGEGLERLFGRGGAILFKGSGFYETDYRSGSYESAKKSETAESCPKAEAGQCDGGACASTD